MVIFLDILLEKRKLISTRSWRGCFPLIINKWNVFQWGNASKMLVHPYKRILLIYSVCVGGRWVHTLVSLENIMFSEKVILKGSYKMPFYLFNTFSNRKIILLKCRLQFHFGLLYQELYLQRKTAKNKLGTAVFVQILVCWCLPILKFLKQSNKNLKFCSF